MPRLHPDAQKAARAGIYAEVGFARSLLAYELPDSDVERLGGSGLSGVRCS